MEKNAILFYYIVIEGYITRKMTVSSNLFYTSSFYTIIVNSLILETYIYKLIFNSGI
jgi:hypothetical protein